MALQRILSASRILPRLILLCILACGHLYCADLVLLDKSPSAAVKEEAAADFYGLSTSAFHLRQAKEMALTLRAISHRDTLAVIVTADSLGFIEPSRLFSALRRTNSTYIPLLVTGITADTNKALLRKWSRGAIVDCEGRSNRIQQTVYRVKTIAGFTRQLSDQELPAGSAACTLTVKKPGDSIITLSSGASESPLFIRTMVGKQELYFSADLGTVTPPLPQLAKDESQYQFSAIAPSLMFLRYAAGDRAWHTNSHYANLTVDDAWLREPYGHLSYPALLREMKKHNFHTTIAFIPWNFERSQPDMVALFRANPERFSICIHGNNHDHQEFPSLTQRSLDIQTANIRQGLARMERFRSLTQLSYDRVMVFPHSIAPTETLGSLKKANFLATTNSENIPLESSPPSDPEFSLRPMTLSFANFPSLRRYSAEEPVDKSELAVNAFLGNPILFYVHEAYFSEGINRFDSVADTVKELQPDTLWRGLGEVAELLYLEKARKDGNYDVKAFTRSLRLENVHPKDATFFIEKDEDFRVPFKVLVDGESQTYSRSGERIRLGVLVRAGASRKITIQYDEDFDLSKVDVSKRSLRVAALRYFSDFRDDVVSRSTTGRKLILGYSQNEQGWNEAGVVFVSVLLTGSLLIWIRRFRSSKERRLRSHELAIGRRGV
jgi:hypothetical protein